MKLAPMNYHYLRYPINRFFDKVERSPFNNIDLYCAAPQFNIFQYPLGLLISLNREIRRRHLTVAAITPENFSYPINFCTTDLQMIEESLRYYQRAIDTAVFLDCFKVQISIGTGYFSDPKDEAWKRCRNSLEMLVQYCEKKGVTLLLEELKETSSNVINNSVQLAHMLAEVDSPNLAGMLDIDQMACCRETPNDYFEHLGSKMQHIHFNDQGHTIPGDGGYPMLEYYQQILECGYKGTCSFEICDRRYYIEPDIALDKIIKWLYENTKEID